MESQTEISAGAASIWDATYLSRPLSLTKRYLLFTFIPWHRDDRGDIWTDDLWLQDLTLHLDYIDHLTVLAPYHRKRDRNWMRLPSGAAERVKFSELPAMDGWLATLASLPAAVFHIVRSVTRTDIVHSGVIGWPVPLSWVTNVAALSMGKRLLLVIESSPWRAMPGSSIWRRVRARCFERVVTAFLDRADLTLFTSEAYKSSLLVHPRGQAIVTPASWIKTSDIVGEKEFREKWPTSTGDRSLRFLCASRLSAGKGIMVLLEALRLLEERRIACDVDIMGEGELAEECRRAVSNLSTVRARVLSPVAYGPRFFDVVRAYDCILSPIITDEQPRIIFDGYSQGCPVLATDTPGQRPHVSDGVSGWLVRPNDAGSLADGMAAAVSNWRRLPEMGCAARQRAFLHTHETMHKRRAEVLYRLFEDAPNTDKS